MRRLIALACVAVAVGCGGGPRGEVSGTVKRGGKPLGNVVVTFVADAGTRGGRATGLTDEQGRYSLRADDGKPGVAVGEYRVTLEDMAIYAAPRSPDGTVTKLPPPRFDAALGDALRTPVRKTVAAGAQTIDVDVP